MNGQKRYVLVTPAKNEAATIGITLETVIAQSARPQEWVIVSDGSTDRTEELVRAASARHAWIKLLALPPREDRNFGSVVRATTSGVRALTSRDYEFIGLLDSDVRLPPEYFERLLEFFADDPQLGLAGGVVIDVGLDRTVFPRNRLDVPGAVQFYRRDCFEKIGELLAVPEGGWDGLACAQARMAGYRTRLITDLVVDHLKPRNSSEGGILRRRWQMGIRDYAVGYHPLFEFAKCFQRMGDRPRVVGGLAWWLGYCTGALQRRPRRIPAELMSFIRREQLGRLGTFFGPPKNEQI